MTKYILSLDTMMYNRVMSQASRVPRIAAYWDQDPSLVIGLLFGRSLGSLLAKQIPNIAGTGPTVLAPVPRMAVHETPEHRTPNNRTQETAFGAMR